MAERNQDFTQEEKCIRQAFSQLDKKVSLPEHLSGNNLLHLLDDVEQNPVTSEKPKGKTYFLSWQAFVTYAAVLGILVAGIRVLPFASNVVSPASGQVEVVYQEDQADGQVELQQEDLQEQDPAYSPRATTPYSEDAVPNVEEGTLTGGGGIEESPQQSSPAVAADTPTTEKAPAPEIASEKAVPAVGGGGRTHVLGQWNEYEITWRANDPTDPDSAQAPVMLEIIDLASNEIHQQIAISSMEQVEQFRQHTNHFVIAGSENGILTVQIYGTKDGKSFDLVEQAAMPGSLYLLEVREDMLFAAASGNSLADGWESTLLKDSREQGSVYLVAARLDGTEMHKLALQGIQTPVSLRDKQFLIAYEDSTGEERHAQVEYIDHSLQLEEDDLLDR